MATYQQNTLSTKWLVEVDRKLGPDGFQLMKALYCRTLPQRTLSENVKTPWDLYKYTALERDDATPSCNVQERERMPPQDSLALFIHRLRILVPQSTQVNPEKRLREIKKKDFGAQDCLDCLDQCGISPPLLRVLISQESKLLEYLVRSYVNLSPRQRLALKRELARLVGVNAGNETMFEIYSELFIKQKHENRCRNVVALFVSSLQNASCPRAVFEQLQQDVQTVGIPLGTIPIPDHDPEPEIDDELVTEITPLLDRHSRKSTKKKIWCCLCLCVPILMGLLMIAVAFPLFAVHLKNKEYSCEVSGSHQVHCPNTEIDAVSVPLYWQPVAVRIGRLNSFWQNYVSISQELPDSRYVYSTISYFVIPSHHIRVHTKQFSCNGTGLLSMSYQLYMLQKSNLNLTVCLRSTNATSQGVRNITICDTFISYSDYTSRLINNCLEQHHLFVEPNGTNCTTLSFTAPRDSFYYITTASIHQRNTSVDYRVDVNLRYLDSADWWDKTPKCRSIGYPPNSCHIWIERKNLFHAEEYTIIATNAEDTKYGYLEVRQRYRSLAYIIPALAATALTLVGYSICLCVGIFRKVIQISGKRHRKQNYKSINN